MANQKGIHHITILAGDAKNNLNFYTKFLGMRMLKKSVNQDDPGTYHLFYGSYAAEPGSSITFFPWPQAMKGEPGTGEAVNVAFQAPQDSREFWLKRFNEWNIAYSEVRYFGREAIRFQDPDGLELDLIFENDAAAKVENVAYEIDPKYVIQGFWGTRLKLAKKDDTAFILKNLFGFEEKATEGNLTLYQTNASIGHSVIIELAEEKRGTNGRGIVHHVAFRAKNSEELDEFRGQVQEWGMHPTQLIDRHWFNSVYYREPGGVLFEMATDDPGYDVDEEFEHLGEKLILPPWLEDKRAQIEEILPEL